MRPRAQVCESASALEEAARVCHCVVCVCVRVCVVCAQSVSRYKVSQSKVDSVGSGEQSTVVTIVLLNSLLNYWSTSLQVLCTRFSTGVWPHVKSSVGPIRAPGKQWTDCVYLYVAVVTGPVV